MSALPDQNFDETHETFSKADVQHIVAREMAKQQIIQLQNGQIELQKKIAELTTVFTSELKGIREAIDRRTPDVSALKSAMKSEFSDEFVTKMELVKTESTIKDQISELDRRIAEQWLKITIPIGVITAIGVLFNWAISVGKALV